MRRGVCEYDILRTEVGGYGGPGVLNVSTVRVQSKYTVWSTS